MKKLVTIAMIVAIAFPAATAFSKSYDGKKVLYIDSYHEGYAWSDGITKGVKAILEGTGAELKIIHMDTKRNAGDAFKQQAAETAKAEIEAFKPDVVIASDDNASKFLIMPFYKDAALPFVFCGVNWDEKVYGYPYKNTTGMVEVTPVPQIVEQLKPFAKGERLGFIAADSMTARKEAENYRKVFGYDLKTYFSKDFEDWKMGFVEMQQQVDILLIESDGGLYNDFADEQRAFVEANTKIPTGSAYDFTAPFALLSYAKVAEEQGAWSAEAALKIIDGTAPADIPVVQNEKGQLFINVRIAKALGLELPYQLLDSADQVIE